jgi:metal-dependent amidase/aminoacylase/carboxypeptidase family protein
VRATYVVRARTLADLDDVHGKVLRCFEAGALASGATLDVRGGHPPYAEVEHDDALAAVYRRNAEAAGRTFPHLGPLGERAAGSTDMGNVSLALPSIHPFIGIDSLPAVNHQPEFAAHCATPAADRALCEGALALAWTAIDCAREPAVRDRLRQRTA